MVGVDVCGLPDAPGGPWRFISYDFGDTTVGFLGLADLEFNLDEDAAVAKIQALDSQVDFLIVSIHWGVEYTKTASDFIQNEAHRYVDAGADFIWGHHPHVIQNSELYNGVPIYYSLGNFVFDQYWSEDTQEGLVVGLKIQGDNVTTVEVLVDLVNLGEPKPREN